MYSAETQKATCFHLFCCFPLNAMSTDFHVKMFSITFFYFQKQTDQQGSYSIFIYLNRSTYAFRRCFLVFGVRIWNHHSFGTENDFF